MELANRAVSNYVVVELIEPRRLRSSKTVNVDTFGVVTSNVMFVKAQDYSTHAVNVSSKTAANVCRSIRFGETYLHDAMRGMH